MYTSNGSILVRIKTYQELLPAIGKNVVRYRIGNKKRVRVNLNTPALKLYKQSNVCAACGMIGSIFALNYSEQYGYVWNLYSANGTIMTKDHIIPKSVGGSDALFNLQIMCANCNSKKDNNICFSNRITKKLIW